MDDVDREKKEREMDVGTCQLCCNNSSGACRSGEQKKERKLERRRAAAAAAVVVMYVEPLGEDVCAKDPFNLAFLPKHTHNSKNESFGKLEGTNVERSNPSFQRFHFPAKSLD